MPKFIDLGELVRQGLPREYPKVAEVFTGQCLLYAGRLNEIHAEPSVGKTNVNCAFGTAVVRAGGVVLFLDPEDTPHGIAAKLASFGLSDAELSERVRYVHNPDVADYTASQQWVKDNPCALVICDGLAEALAAEGLNEDVPADVLKFFRLRLRPFAEVGAAVLVSDHVAKNSETRGRWARGSGAKLGRYDGVSYSLNLGEPYSREKAGFVRLDIAKDRVGGVGVFGQTVAELHFSPSDDGTHLEWKRPEAKGEFVPTGLMAKVCRHLTINPEASLRDLRALGNSDYVDDAIEALRVREHIRVTPGGRGKKTTYELITPFVEGNQ